MQRFRLPGRNVIVPVFVLLASAVAPLLKAQAPQPEQGYQMPPKEIQDILTRDRHFDTLDNLSPDGTHFLIPLRDEFSNLKLMSEKTYRLAMLELTPRMNREWRLSTYGIRGFKIFSLTTKTAVQVELPPDVFVSDPVWSPDGKKLAFLAHLPNESQVWTADVESGKAQAVSKAAVMATLAGRPQFRRQAGPPSRMLQWTPEGSLLTLLVPSDRGPEPQTSALPSSPIIRHTRSKATPTPTYPFLLRTPRDKDLFTYYTTAQLAELSSGQSPRPIGKPGMYLNVSLSPDGKYILAEKVVPPLSYITSYSNFPRELEVLDRSGRVLSTVRKIPLQEGFRRGGQGGPQEDLPREVSWRPDGSGLSLLWREPKGEKKEEANGEEANGRRKDRLMFLSAPFDPAQARLLVASEKGFSNVRYAADGHYAFASLTGRGGGSSGRRDIIAYDLTTDPPQEKALVSNIDPKDIFKLPGEIVTRRTGNGIVSALLSSQDRAVFLEGPGYREDFKPRPFVDRIEIENAASHRIFESSAQMYERPLEPLDRDFNQMVISRESLTDFPDSYLWNSDGSLTKLTDNHDPFPEVANCKRIDFEFTRRDGLKIEGRLSLPVGYKEGTRVPAVFWTYPREYESFSDYHKAAIRSRNHNRFPHLNYRNASDIWLTQGYAVVEPDIPIVGRNRNYNNNYIAHLVDSMYGAIRKMDEMGYVDVDRLGHGGHSYGAFATANILAHTPFFKAGIAGDGAYNRSLTPMTFQNERRFLWEAQDTILEMSPFFYADHLNTPLLMYHGGSDNNTGTFLIQSERMIQALTGLGKTAVLYIYPFESHGPRARETYMDLWSRWLQWFDKYVRNASTPSAGAPVDR